MARKANEALRKIKRLEAAVEVKDATYPFDLTLSGVAAFNLKELNGIGQGTSDDTRIGSDIMIKSIALRYKITAGAALFATGNVLRVLLVYDRANVGNQTDITHVLQAQSSRSLYNNAEKYLGRFQILMDRVYTGSASDMVVFDKFYTNRRLRTHFGTTAPGFAGVEKGLVTLFILADESLGATVTMQVMARVRYLDA